MSNSSNTQIRFYYNGIKATKGAKLEKAYYTGSEQMIVIYGRHYASFSTAIREALNVTNDSDIMTDYFVNDRICLTPEHRYFAAAYAALQASEAKNEARRALRAERSAQFSR